MEGRRPGILFTWFLDGGLSLGKREKGAPAAGPVDIVCEFVASRRDPTKSWCFYRFDPSYPERAPKLKSPDITKAVHSTLPVHGLVMVFRNQLAKVGQSQTAYGGYTRAGDEIAKRKKNRGTAAAKTTNVQREESSAAAEYIKSTRQHSSRSHQPTHSHQLPPPSTGTVHLPQGASHGFQAGVFCNGSHPGCTTKKWLASQVATIPPTPPLPTRKASLRT